eukprot:409744-Rhodomonas_salina.1
MGNALPVVAVGSGVVEIGCGNKHTCAVFDDWSVKCWGEGSQWQLGYKALGLPVEQDRSTPHTEAVDIGVGGHESVSKVCSWVGHTCVLLVDGRVLCWKDNTAGQLGWSTAEVLLGASTGPVDLGTGRTATAIACGSDHVCVVLDDTSVKCWGDNGAGQLGLGDTESRGDENDPTMEEMGANLPAVVSQSGGCTTGALDVGAGGQTTCVVLSGTTVWCWGSNNAGQLGLGDTNDRGDDVREITALADAGTIDLSCGKGASSLLLGLSFTCTVMNSRGFKCWGDNSNGILGYGDTEKRGDDPNEMGDYLRSRASHAGSPQSQPLERSSA